MKCKLCSCEIFGNTSYCDDCSKIRVKVIFQENSPSNDDFTNEMISTLILFNFWLLEDFLKTTEGKNWRVKEIYTNNNGLTVIERVDG